MDHPHIITGGGQAQALERSVLQHGAVEIVTERDVTQADVSRVVCKDLRQAVIAGRADAFPIVLMRHRDGVFNISAVFPDNRVGHDEVLPVAVHHRAGRITADIEVGSGCRIQIAADAEVDQETQIESFIREIVRQTEHPVRILVTDFALLGRDQRQAVFPDDHLSVVRIVLVRHTQECLAINIAVITTLHSHNLDRIQRLDVIERHARIKVDDLVTVQRELRRGVPTETLRIDAPEDVAVQRDFQPFVLDVTGVDLAGAVAGKRVERQVQQLAGRIRLIPSEVQPQSVLEEADVETGFPRLDQLASNVGVEQDLAGRGRRIAIVVFADRVIII